MSKSAVEFHRREDFIEYFLFPKVADETEFLNVFAEIKSIVESHCGDYIWHRDAFSLTPRFQFNQLLSEEESSKKSVGLEIFPPHYHGISHFGENIQDEWFIVFMLLELTKKVPGLVGRCVDSDGEFLLIEAADHLPGWANPETCEQRVFFINGEVHLLHNPEAKTDEVISIEDGIRHTRNGEACDNITAFIQDRIQDYPERIKEDIYRTTLFVPLGVAKLLKAKPSLISAACNAFWNRDSIDMKACRAMRFFPPENRVYTPVVFSKCLYAMISHSKYVPDRRVGWNLPPNIDPTYKSHILGVKIASGFEILASQAKPPQNIEEDRGWAAYKKSLESKNYFQDNIEGSKSYQSLLEAAKTYYRDHRETMNSAEEVGEEIIAMIQSYDPHSNDFLQTFSSELIDENDNWLNISPDELDDIMTKRYGIKKVFSSGGGNLNLNLTGDINQFLETQSEYDGIENREATTSGKNLVKSSEAVKLQNLMKSPTNANEDKIDFDPDSFKMHVSNFLDLLIPEDNWESNSDMSEYEDDDDIGKAMNASNSDRKIDLKKYMKEMDLELSKTTMGKSFEKKATKCVDEYDEDDFDDVENFTPVDIDRNMVKNLIEGYSSQVGGPGPISNLLSSMGIGMKLDDDSIEKEKDSETKVQPKISEV